VKITVGALKRAVKEAVGQEIPGREAYLKHLEKLKSAPKRKRVSDEDPELLSYADAVLEIAGCEQDGELALDQAHSFGQIPQIVRSCFDAGTDEVACAKRVAAELDEVGYYGR
jgi:hypothetical protein